MPPGRSPFPRAATSQNPASFLSEAKNVLFGPKDCFSLAHSPLGFPPARQPSGGGRLSRGRGPATGHLEGGVAVAWEPCGCQQAGRWENRGQAHLPQRTLTLRLPRRPMRWRWGKWVRRQKVDHTGPPGPPVLPCRGLNVSRPVCPGLAV